MAHLPNGLQRPIAEINVVPFIDVMLVLLIIFMITAPMLTQGVKVDLPKTSSKTLAPDKEPIIVSVDASGNFYINLAEKPHIPVTAQTLDHLVREELMPGKVGTSRPFLVRGDKNVNYGKIVEAMVLLQQAGVKSVNLMTQLADKQHG